MKQLTILLCYILASTSAMAQTERQDKLEKEIKALQNFKVSGYIQTQVQAGEKDASLSVGSKNEDNDKSFNRIGIRRGRIKFAYDQGIASGVFQLDITEKGVNIKEAYINIIDPFIGSNSIRTGVFNRPFGHEIVYSSSSRETPERSTIFRTLFPDERDLGGMITLKASPSSQWSFLELNAGLFAGNGIKQDSDSKKDFIGQIKFNKNINSSINLALGTSYYYGNVYQGTENIYKMSANEFVLSSDDNNIGKFAKREYIGLDGQVAIKSILGKTKLSAEYLFGTQPGTQSSNKSPNSSTAIVADTYIRNFNGGYVTIVQDLGKSPIAAVIKYDWYNPNTKVSGNDIGLNNTGIADIAYDTIGFGLLWSATKSIRLQAYYELVTNEKTENLNIFNNNIKDNILTLRLQYKF